MSQNSRHDDRYEETPPLSRVFIVYNKDLTEQELRVAFEDYGEIENLFIPKDRTTGTPRGVAYIKYAKTSSAAAAIEAMNQKTIANSHKPLKVMIASKKDDLNDNRSNYKYDRIFIKISKQATVDELQKYFSQFGSIESVFILKDKQTSESKGLAYVQYQSFLQAATALENCDSKYKAVFASPKSERKRGLDDVDYGNDTFGNSYNHIMPYNDTFNDHYRAMSQHGNNLPPLMKSAPLNRTPLQNFKVVVVTCTPVLPQRYLERLFNIVPGMHDFQYNEHLFNGYCKAVVTYEDERAAAHAVDRLNNYEFPSGEVLTVKPDNPLSKAADNLTSILSSFKTAVDSGNPDLQQIANAIAEASTLIKAAASGGININQAKEMSIDVKLCNVPLPPVQPLAHSNAKMAKRCFIVCKPKPPPQHIIRDIFCRFGDLIDITLLSNKNYGFVKYSTEKAADEAIRTLHGATIYGMISLKVIEAEEPKQKVEKMIEDDDEIADLQHRGDRKRTKHDNDL